MSSRYHHIRGKALDLTPNPAIPGAPLILIVAQNHERFITWCYAYRLNPLDRNRVRYIQSPEKLRPYNGDKERLIVVGDLDNWMDWYPILKTYESKVKIAQESKCKDLKTIALVNVSKRTIERWFNV